MNLMMIYLYTFNFLIIYNHYLTSGEEFVKKLSSVLEKSLQFYKLQEYFKDLQYLYRPPDGDKVTKEITLSINQRILKSISALQLIKEAAESVKTESVSCKDLEKCETTNIQETVVRYWNVTYPPTGLLDIMESTAQIQHVNRQILAMEDRTMMIYPSPPSGISSEVVKHYSQLFASTLSPVEKDLVIVIDRSGSMAAVHGTKTLLQITIEAVTFVLETLTANDRIGIVVFDTGTVVPGAASRKCVGSKLAKATPENVKFYQSILQNIQIGARTNYELALREAFKFFKHSNYTTESEQREKIILFLTDGLPTVGKDPVKTIAEENKILNNSVAIFTYGIGQLLNDTIVDVLQKMSGQVESDPKYGIVRKGEFKKIANPSKLQDILASYWKPFRKSENRIRVSLPYDDKSNLGFITSLCKQLHKKDKKIFGMVCIDVRLSSLFREVFLLENVKNSYAFVIDGMGRTYIHSSLKPIALNSDAVIVDIESLERDEAVASILESMKRGETGSQRILSTRVSSRGNTFIDGVQERKMWSTYYWNPLKGTNLSLCVVITEGGGEVLYNASSPSPEKFNYHRLDLLTSTGGACNHFNRYASKEYSTVLLTPKAFVDPDFNLENEDINDVLSYTNFLSGKSSTDPGFKTSILQSVIATYYAEQLWLQFHHNPSIWKYIGTEDGVFRIYPGTQLPQNYDHTQRPWYKRSIARRGQIVITGPYPDLLGSGHVITVSKTIETRMLMNNTFLIGVAATDISITYFYQFMSESSLCQESPTRCSVIDDSGILVLHDDFVDISTKSLDIEDIHITQKEPIIAKNMLENGVLSRKSYLDVYKRRLQYTFRVSPVNFTNSHYQLLPLPNSNLFILVERQQFFNTQIQCCGNFNEFPAGQQCVNKAECECLCYKTAAYDYCNNNFKWERETLHSPICTGGPSIANAEPLRGIHRPHNVQRCFDTKCSDKISKRDCYNTAGCSWCSKSSELARLELEFCTEWDSCYFGIRGNSPTKYYRQDNGKSKGHHPESKFGISIFLIIGPVVIFLSLISSVSVLILWLKRRKIYLKSKRIPSTLPARADGVPPTENGYTHVVTRVFPDTPYVSRTPFGEVAYHHNFVFDHST